MVETSKIALYVCYSYEHIRNYKKVLFDLKLKEIIMWQQLGKMRRLQFRTYYVCPLTSRSIRHFPIWFPTSFSRSNNYVRFRLHCGNRQPGHRDPISSMNTDDRGKRRIYKVRKIEFKIIFWAKKCKFWQRKN